MLKTEAAFGRINLRMDALNSDINLIDLVDSPRLFHSVIAWGKKELLKESLLEGKLENKCNWLRVGFIEKAGRGNMLHK